MEAWRDSSIPGISELTPTNITSSGSSPILNYSDPLLSKILTSKKALHVLESNLVNSNDNTKPLIELLIASCDGDLVTLENTIRSQSDNITINTLFPSEDSGISCLIYSICFNNYPVTESLLNNHNADPDVYDTIVHYTPLMWAVYLNQLDMVKLLLDHQADPNLSPKEDGKNAISLVTLEHLEMYDFFKSHGLLRLTSAGAAEEIYGTSSFQGADFEDELSADLRMHTLSTEPEEDSRKKQKQDLDDEDDEYILAQNVTLQQLDEFDYEKLLPNQYLKFSDQDIPILLDYIFELRSKPSYQHNTKLPSTIIFQLVRYAHLKVESQELTDFLFDCFVVRLRTVTNTKSGAFNMALQDQETPGGAGDIVLLSYWLSSIQFLHFYFTRNKLYTNLPHFLQEIINLTQSLIATLSFSINSRLNILVDDCLINFTNLIDVSNVMYAKDWNLFKKNKTHPSSYDDILEMLYPPSELELMRPSPLKYIQVLGALDYVLKIHQVDNLLQIQTFSQVFYYINCVIFNRLISQSKYCSRAKAIQIRLNISTIEDWFRSHNMKVYKPDKLGLEDSNNLKNLLEIGDSKNNPHYLQFYYNSLYHVGKSQLIPTIELLQWLQCMSSLQDEDGLINTINQFDYVNYYQLFKVANKLYKYEVEETKLPKKCLNLLRRLMNEQGSKQIEKTTLHYMTQATFLSKEIYIYLNPNFIFNVSLPNVTELINNYGAGLGGVRLFRSKKYQPSLPISILDDIDELLLENKNQHIHDAYDYENEEDEQDEGDQVGDIKSKDFKGDEIFKEVQMPNSLLHKNWGQEENNFEVNPW
ncbi:Dilute domain-containing protein [Spathaspora sp. JA1]|nr:Dilute domain-containing protein [Spathaspora sp. JA1]